MTNYEDEDSLCPICGNPIVLEQGLEVCYYCGWSRDEWNGIKTNE